MMPKRGRKSFFTREGKVALMFLKMYTVYQMFCDVIVDPGRPLTNYKLLDDIMLELAGNLKIQQLQAILADRIEKRAHVWQQPPEPKTYT